jgi:hypothetical protein
MAEHNHWHPTWYKDEHATSWERVKAAVLRDWEQTKHDLHLKGGHYLHQDATDTVKQAMGKESLPPYDQPNPQKVIGEITEEWDHVELPLEYGVAARQQYGKTYRNWDADLEKELQLEWESPKNPAAKAEKWDDVKQLVRHGYDYKA